MGARTSSGMGSRRPAAERLPKDRPRRRAARDLLEARALERGLEPGPHERRRLALPSVHVRVALERASAVTLRVRHGGLEQRRGEARAAECGTDEETWRRPHALARDR